MSFDPQTLRLQFLQYGLRSARELAQAVKVSQPTISRALAGLSDSIVRVGHGRSLRYGMKAPVAELGSSWPLYVIGLDGLPEQLGHLHSLLGGKYWLERGSKKWPSLFPREFQDNLFPDLPWFLDDYRPQGFLGRALARKHAGALGQEPNPVGWSGRVVVEAMLRFGGDFQGAFVLGREALTIAMAPGAGESIRHEDRERLYPRLAMQALNGELVGSSAGGEQPKFVVATRAATGMRNLMVKFSPVMSEALGRRWADLLYAEHLAGRVLSDHGFSVARSEVVDAENRRFLEVERFDLNPNGGRQPLISLRTMGAALLDGIGMPWSATAAALLKNGWLDEADAGKLASIWRFGKLIANTDMHDGNASLVFTPEKPVRLAPIYDMLPMAYRPDNQGQLPGVSESQLAMASSPSFAKERKMAEEFWVQISNSALVSKEFRNLAAAHAVTLRS